MAGKQQISAGDGTESGTLCDGLHSVGSGINQKLAAALALISDLPLTNEEKAQAVRELLGREHKNH